MTNSNNTACMQCIKPAAHSAADTLTQRVHGASSPTGTHTYPPSCTCLRRHVAGGLTENDFIVACKINALDTKDLLMKKKPKFWA